MHGTIPLIPQKQAPEPSRVTFSGDRGEFRRLITRGAFLELVTAGFYRFWLTTDMRRHLWSHTSVDGDAPEYTGTAKELLVGFLVALAILAPLYAGYFLLTLEAERMAAFASFPLVLFFLLFSQFAIYRARRYRLTRTIWRGVRFWMGGSGWNYAWRAVLWSALVFLTLGLALPWRTAALERFKMRNTHYGDLQGRFEGTGMELFKQGWWLWLITWPLALFIVPLPFIYAAYKAIEWRWWLSGIRFGEVRIESDLRDGALIGLYWKVIGWGLLAFVALGAWFGVVGGAIVATGVASTPEQYAQMTEQWPVMIAWGAGYLVAAIAFGLVMRLYLMRDLWARVASTVTIHDLAAAANVTAKGEEASAIGEGLADSLDVGGF